MARDYVRNQPQKRKTNAKRGPAKSAPTSRLPIVAIVIAVIALSGFGYFLYTISGSADNAEIIEVIATPAPKAKTPAEKPLPEKPKEKWDYIEQLENKEVEVDVPADPPPAIPYQMQCGSFRDKGQAESLKAKIAFQGLESQVRRSEGKNGIWYKVVLGPYERKRLAQTDSHKLTRAKIRNCQIWQWQGPLPK
ncbi:SPOR domain-containing protein [Motilimonas cestriensis]|uniref:SPOR domain-containing protein n=1 Tax=Motilimonas cestriensis TaxID=2742685 RepID=A0ABS8WBM0_9GAMM|nr:SPOR domain-containing protein [Motilimonas cestriensis]MCE2594986.1 SPOR domain-containing protein [Motilimonas cestriensis]